MSAAELRRLIEARLDGHTDRRDEAAILDALAQADAAALEGALMEMDLARLIGDLDDRVFGPSHRTALFRSMLDERLADQSVRLRARWVDALARGNTDDLDERALRSILVGTRGAELTALKNAIDEGDDHRHLLHVLHSDIDDAVIRGEILSHIRSEAEALPCAGRKVLSDIDDTFYCNWTDQRFPSETVYPGVIALYESLSTGGEVVFVTARPEDRTGVVEKVTHRTLRSRGVRAPVILAGSFTKLHSHDAIADGKLGSFVRYAELYPEYEMVFLGDSGQGDAAFGAAMREHAPEQVRAVLIHDVVGVPVDERARWRERGVELFDTYVGAARLARGIGLLDDDAVRRVREAADTELAALAFDTDALRAARLAELARDCEGVDLESAPS